MITAHEVETAGFRRAGAGSIGYDEDAVDDFLDRVVETLSAIERDGECPAEMLSAHDVVEVVFAERNAHTSGGYDLDDVDDLLDRVAQRIHRYEEGLRRAADPTAGRAPAQHVADGEKPNDESANDERLNGDAASPTEAGREVAAMGAASTTGAGRDGDDASGDSRAVAPQGTRDDHLVTPIPQVHEGRGDAENPAVADLDRQDDRADAGMSAGAGAAGGVAGAAASAGAVGAAAVEQKRVSAAHDVDDRRDLADAQGRADGSTDMAAVVHSSPAREDDVVRVVPAREESPAPGQGVEPGAPEQPAVPEPRVEPVVPEQRLEVPAAPVGAVGQPDARQDDVRAAGVGAPGVGADDVHAEGVEGASSAGADAVRPAPGAGAMRQENASAPEESTRQPKVVGRQTQAPEPDESLRGVNMVGAPPLDEVRTDTHERPDESVPSPQGPETSAQTPAHDEGDVRSAEAVVAEPGHDAVSPEERFDAQRRDDEVAAPAADLSTHDAAATDAPSADAATDGVSKPGSTDSESPETKSTGPGSPETKSTQGEPDDRQVNDHEERVVVTCSGGAPSVTPLETGASTDEEGERFESFTAAPEGTFAEPGVREPADETDAHDATSATTTPAGPKNGAGSAQGLTVQPAEARLAADPGVTGQRSRRLHDAWHAAVVSDEERDGIISYPATDHRVPLPRGEARREVSEQDREAESQFHPEYSSYASPETPEAPEPQAAAEPEGTPVQGTTDDERGRVRVVGRPGDPAPKAPEPQQNDDVETEGSRSQAAQSSSLSGVEPTADSRDVATRGTQAPEAGGVDDVDHPAATGAEIDEDGIDDHATAGSDTGAGAEESPRRAQAPSIVPAEQDEFDPFAERSAVADEPLTPTVETPSAMRSETADESRAPVEARTHVESPAQVEPLEHADSARPAAPAASTPDVTSGAPSDAPVEKEAVSMTPENGDELQRARLDDDRAEPSPRAEPIERPESIDVPQGIETARELPARDDTSRKGLLRRIFKG